MELKDAFQHSTTTRLAHHKVEEIKDLKFVRLSIPTPEPGQSAFLLYVDPTNSQIVKADRFSSDGFRADTQPLGRRSVALLQSLILNTTAAQ